MSDLISKQRAIEAIDKFIPADPMMSDYTHGISVGLAIATRCIEEFSQENHDSSQGLVKDLISRQAAIDAVEFGITYAKAIDVNTGESKELFKEGNDALKKAVERLKELPSAEPRKGKWIWDEDGADWGIGAWICSKCERKPNTWWEIDEKVNPLMCSGSSFCGNCGADMRGEQE